MQLTYHAIWDLDLEVNIKRLLDISTRFLRICHVGLHSQMLSIISWWLSSTWDGTELYAFLAVCLVSSKLLKAVRRGTQLVGLFLVVCSVFFVVFFYLRALTWWAYLIIEQTIGLWNTKRIKKRLLFALHTVAPVSFLTTLWLWAVASSLKAAPATRSLLCTAQIRQLRQEAGQKARQKARQKTRGRMGRETNQRWIVGMPYSYGNVLISLVFAHHFMQQHDTWARSLDVDIYRNEFLLGGWSILDNQEKSSIGQNWIVPLGENFSFHLFFILASFRQWENG